MKWTDLESITYINVKRKKEMIINKEYLYYQTNSLCHHFRECMGNIMKNIQTDVHLFHQLFMSSLITNIKGKALTFMTIFHYLLLCLKTSGAPVL